MLDQPQGCGDQVGSGVAAIIRQTLEYLEEHGLVNPSHSEYVPPVVLAPKHYCSWRSCVDYRRLNAISGMTSTLSPKSMTAWID